MSQEPTPAKRRNFIRFQTQASRKVLTREQYQYWYDILRKVIKIGTEFELNIPGSSVNINHAKSDRTPCIEIKSGCSVNDCSNLEECLVERHPALCKTRASGSFLGESFACPASGPADTKACESCAGWSLLCAGTSCSLFSPHCAVCPSFKREGKDLPENTSIHRDVDTIREEMRRLLNPTEFVGEVGPSGVLEVKKDGSLVDNGGVEIPTVGRRVHWNSFYLMCQKILAAAAERGAYVNERCGQHYHILAGYLKDNGSGRGRSVSELELPMPEIILANLHQIIRRYEMAMFWITSSGQSREHLTRWARYRQSVFPYSALRQKMSVIKLELAAEIICMNGTPKDGKYASVAYHFCDFDPNGDVKTFHIENRIADGVMSPAAATAYCMLFYAMVLKAARLSQYGVMEVGDKEYTEKLARARPHLIEGEKRDWNSDRKADTSEIAPHIPFLIANAVEMVSFMKPELQDAGPAYDILMSLANKPCSLRRIEGHSWDKIEEDLMRGHKAVTPSSLEGELQEIIDLASLVDMKDLEEWLSEAAAYTGMPTEEIREVVKGMIHRGQCRWSDPIGAVIST